MRAVGFTEFGSLDVLKVLEVPEPHPGPGEVRVRVVAAGVSPSDGGLPSGETVHIWRGMGLLPPADVYIAGFDAAGVVDEVGPGVEGFALGTAVVALATALRPKPAYGTHAEHVVVSAQSAVRVPLGADLIAWSTLLMNALTAHRAIEMLELPPRATVAVTGAAGAVGGFAVQLAKRRGHVVIADAAEKDRDVVAAFGADHILARGKGFARLVRAVASAGVDGVVDSALLEDDIHPAVRDGGVIAALRGYQGSADRGVRWVWPFIVERLEDSRALNELRDYAQAGCLALRVACTYTPEQAALAYGATKQSGLRGRPVIVFDASYPNYHLRA